jgi:twitching motility protein PilT
VTLSETLKAVVAQTLLKRKDNRGRCAALDIMVVNPAVSNMIREGKTYQLTSIIQTGRKLGMQTLDDSILELLNKGLIDPEEAYYKSIDKEKFSANLKTTPDFLV